MNHVEEERLILYYYGEAEGREEVAAHLEACELCRREFASLRRVLDAVNDLPVPERGSGYGAEVWRRIEPKLEAPKAKVIAFPSRRTMQYAAVAAMLVAAFYLGKFTQSQPQTGPPSQPVAAVPAQVRERILLMAVGDHLERSRMVLAELTNASPTRPVDIGVERGRAQDLLEDSRLYRQTAAQSGDSKTAGMLEELERVLVEVARSPSMIGSTDLEQLRSRIEEQGLMFKMRVVESNIRGRIQETGSGEKL